MEDDKNKISTPMAIVVAGFLVMVGLFVNKLPAQNPNTNIDINTEDSKTNEDVSISLDPISADDHIRNNSKNTQIVIVEYSDTECPFCKDFHNTMIQVMDKYGDKVAWVYRHFPIDSLHQKARKEAEATECANKLGGNDAFWKYLDMIFESTPSNDKLDLALLPTFAEKIGLNVTDFNQCLDSGEFKDKVQVDFESGVRAGVQGTPYSVIITKDGTQIPLNGADDKKLFETLDKFIK